MVRLEDAVIARYESRGERFEVLIDPDAVDRIRRGEEVDLESVLAAFSVFSDSKKGLRPSEAKINQVFGTNDMETIVRRIVRDGQVQLTTEQRHKMQERRRKAIIDFIARNAINPQTGSPHTPHRLDIALREAKVNIDPMRSVEEQVGTILEKLRPILPIRLAMVRIAVRLSGEDHGRCYGSLRKMGTIVQEEWQSSGHWIGVVEIPAGMQVELFQTINDKTRGQAETKILK